MSRVYSTDYLTDLLMNTEDTAERYRQALQEILRAYDREAPDEMAAIARNALESE